MLACGGFENNNDMIQTFLAKPFATAYGSPANTGDGIRMAQALGARLSNMYQHMPYYGIKVPGHATGEFLQPPGPGFINVRKDGRRFINELINYQHGKPVIGGRARVHPAQSMWTVFDEDVRLAGPLTPTRDVYACGWLKQVERYDWSSDNSVEIEQGWIVKGDTLRELAEKLGVDPEGLEAEVAHLPTSSSRKVPTLTSIARPRDSRRSTRAPFYGYAWGNLLINTRRVAQGRRGTGPTHRRRGDPRPVRGGRDRLHTRLDDVGRAVDRRRNGLRADRRTQSRRCGTGRTHARPYGRGA